MNKFINKFFYLSIVFMLIGILFYILPPNIVMVVSYRLVCIIIIIIGIVKLVLSDKKALGEKEYWLDLTEGFINIIVGVVCFNFYHVYITSLVFGVIYLVIPILRIAISTNKLNQLIIDVFKFIFAILLIVSSYKMPEITKFYSASIFLLIGIGIMVIKIVLRVKSKNNSEELF